MTPQCKYYDPNSNHIFLGHFEDYDLFYDYNQRIVLATDHGFLAYWWPMTDNAPNTILQEAQKRTHYLFTI